MEEKKYVEGFVLYYPNKGQQPPKERPVGKPVALDLSSRTIKVSLDNTQPDNLEFLNKTEVMVNGEGPWLYEALPVKQKLYLLTVHQLAMEVPQYIAYIIDEEQRLATRILCNITRVERGSTPLSDTENLVKREIRFGYIGEGDPINRHHYTHDLCDAVLETAGNPTNVIRYYIHSDRKLSYHQRVWPADAYPADRDGVGYGEAALLKISDEVYLITFTKHSHGNQPMLLWNRATGVNVANFAGVSRQLHCPFVCTAGGYLKQII